MGSTGTAAYDPIFYMHHCFIDYIWEIFRQRQMVVCRVDPTEDYSDVVMTSREGHEIDDAMTGMEFYKMKDGLASWWTGGSDPWFTYDDTPICPYCGGSHHLTCDHLLNRCIPDSRIREIIDEILEPSRGRPSTSSPTAVSASTMSSSSSCAYASTLIKLSKRSDGSVVQW